MKISVVTTLYHSVNYLPEFYRRILGSILKITPTYEIIFVNDGSPDASLLQVLEIQKNDRNVIAIDLSRNFGHQKAMMAGLTFAKGDYVFLIDVDLEEEPELLLAFWEELLKSTATDVVFGVQKSRKGNFLERHSGKMFYQFFSMIADINYPPNPLTARLMSKRYIESIIQYKEKEIDLWGLFVLNGFNQKEIFVTKGHKGSTTYTLRKKIKHAIDVITSFSSKPLYLIFVFGVGMLFLSSLNICFIIYQKIRYGTEVEGWASVLASIWLIGGLIIFILGIIGIYLSKIFLEVKNRPLTVIKEVYRSENPS